MATEFPFASTELDLEIPSNKNSVMMHQTGGMEAGYIMLIVIAICGVIVLIKLKFADGLTDEEEEHQERERNSNKILNKKDVVLVFNEEKFEKLKQYECTLSDETSDESEESDTVLRQTLDH